MNIIDLFSGGGGLTEGFKQTGYNILCHVEMDKDACDTLRTREAYYFLKENNRLDTYNDYLQGKISKENLYKVIPMNRLKKVLNYRISHEDLPTVMESINDLKGVNSIDGIIGGPPCQAYSTIGRARNKLIKETDERVYLYKFYAKFLEAYSPNFFIFENVKGLLSYKDFLDQALLPEILNEFESKGYNVEYRIINSEEFGVPQKRERVFIFGIKKSCGISAREFFDGLQKYKESSINIGDLFQDLPKMQSGEESNRYSNFKPVEFVSRNIRNGNYVLSQNIVRPNNLRDKKIYKLVVEAKNEGGNLKYNELPEALRTHKNDQHFLDRFKCLDEKKRAHTLVAHISKDGHYYIHPDKEQNRSISVREAARIQTFPDNYYFESSRTAALKQIGNAVPVVLAKKIAMGIDDIF